MSYGWQWAADFTLGGPLPISAAPENNLIDEGGINLLVAEDGLTLIIEE